MTLDFKEIQKHFQPRSALALSIEPGALVAALVHRDGAPPRSSITLDISADALVAEPAKAGAALAAALDAAQIRERRCAVCAPPSWALSAAADLPEISPEDLRGYFELRAEREFSTPDLRLSHSAYALPDGTRRATLAAIPEKRMEGLEKFLHAAGCRPVSISLGLPGCISQAEPALHLLAHGSATDLVISTGDGIAALRTIPSDSAAFARELKITLGRLPEALRSRLKQARLTGHHTSALAEIVEKMGLTAASDEATRSSDAAVESASRYLRHTPVPFEFFVAVPNRWNEALGRFNTPKGRRTIATVATVVFLPVLAFSFRSHQESRLTSEWNGMKNVVTELDSIQQKIRQFRPWFEPVPQKLQALRTVIAAFPDRGDLWTRSVQITPYIAKNDNASRGTPNPQAATVTVNGFSQTNTALMSLQDTLGKQPGVSALQVKQVRGNNPIQFSLTFKWELRHD